MGKVYGYARVSTNKQKIDRQIVNIKKENGKAIIFQESFTGTTNNRKEFKKLLSIVKAGDTIIFDEVSRMSRNYKEGIETYFELCQKGIELIFIKEPYINTKTYKKALKSKIKPSGNNIADIYINATNMVLEILQKEQIELAFKTAQKEIDYLHQRTSEGIKKAQSEGKIVGRKTGSRIETKKAKEYKQVIRKSSKSFGGNLSDVELMKLTGLARNTYYKYKRELNQ